MMMFVVVEAWTLPETALMVMVWVFPGTETDSTELGCPRTPHELKRMAIPSIMLASPTRLMRFTWTSNNARPATPRINQPALSGLVLCLSPGQRSPPKALPVDTVRTELPVAEAGVSTPGAKEHVIPSGRFEHEKDTGASNEPVSELTVMLACADCPFTMVAAAGDAPEEDLGFRLRSGAAVRCVLNGAGNLVLETRLADRLHVECVIPRGQRVAAKVQRAQSHGEIVQGHEILSVGADVRRVVVDGVFVSGYRSSSANRRKAEAGHA